VTPTFAPERCPNPRCAEHARTAAGAADGAATGSDRFFRYKGTFEAAGPLLVRRAQCRTCGRHFSERTLQPDPRARRHDVGPPARRLLAGGLSVRAVARLLGVSRSTVRRRREASR
jgi:transposase-like protein